jgi:hypothetical protein
MKLQQFCSISKVSQIYSRKLEPNNIFTWSVAYLAMNVWNKGQKKNGSCVAIKMHIIVIVYAIHQVYLKSFLTRVVNVHGFELNIAIEYTKKIS